MTDAQEEEVVFGQWRFFYKKSRPGYIVWLNGWNPYYKEDRVLMTSEEFKLFKELLGRFGSGIGLTRG